MKKIILTGIALWIFLTSFAQPKTVYINSQTITCDFYGRKKECLQYKTTENDTAWKTYNNSIRGFTYNPGYFYTLQVQQLQGNTPQWKLVKVVSKTKSITQQQPGDTVAGKVKPPAALVGQWYFTRLLNDAEGINFSAGKELLQFDANELKITGKASCNSFFSNYTVEGTHQIKFEAAGHTMLACEAMTIETKMLKALELVDSYTITGTKLELQTNGKTLIELTKSAPTISPNGGK